MLRNFGHTITHLHVDLYHYKHPSLHILISQYLIEYCSESLIHLSLEHGYWPLFENLAKQFVNVKTLQVHLFCILNNSACLTLLEKFPNLQFLKLNWNRIHIPFNIKIHYPNLKHLYFRESFFTGFECAKDLSFLNYGEDKTMEEYCTEFLKLNTQIENLELRMLETWRPTFFHWISENLPHLKCLSLNCKFQIYIQNISSTFHFHNVQSFTFNLGERFFSTIPFSFTNLNHLTILSRTDRKFEFYLSTPVLDFIAKNKFLTSLRIECDKLYKSKIFRIFEFEHIISSLEELSVEKIYPHIPSNSLLRFLNRNCSLKTISLIMDGIECFASFLDLIMASDVYEVKIRNNALEFTVERITDGSKMKYMIRRTKSPLRQNFNFCREYFEFCNYGKPKFVVKTFRG